MQKTLTGIFNTAVNAMLRLDPASEKRLHKLQGVVVGVEILPFHFMLQMLVNDNALHVQEEAVLQPDVIIRGTPLQMTALALNQNQKQKFFADDIEIEGNADLAQDVLHLFNHLHIDWEELLSNFIGDVPAYHTSQFARRAHKWLRDVEQSFTQNVSEYVQEEKQWLPTREALQDFFDDVDSLRLDVDRVEARVRELQQT